MKLLIYQWSAYLEQDVFSMVQEKGISYSAFSWKFTDKNEDEKFVSWFREEIQINDYDALLSINYWPLLSQVCQEQGLKYIAWCYDNPLNVVRIEETLGNPVNHVFLFDRIQYKKYKTAGFDTVYHLPLGVNRSRMKALTVSSDERSKYTAEVALVGKLYESQFPEIMAPLSDYTKGFIEALIKVQLNIRGSYLLDDCISDALLQDINRQYLEKEPNTQVRMSREALSYAMASEVTRRDRIVLLSLSGMKFDTRLYSYQHSEIIKKVKQYPKVDYYTEMPKIFACSKINLNPSLRIIQTGIPLRAFDIMGAGGFLLSNHQEELLELFENEKEMVVYESMEEAIDKIDFYLKHGEMREKIALNGKKKTWEKHSLQDRLEKILTM